ncbi:response regulator [Asticcacaulis solisilvae]|uniref:response regulator n=1 Tax=Asticcacaulis solisilvae TaxID=1217274 RepID=UPI003FD8294D
MKDLRARYVDTLKQSRDDLHHAHEMALLWSCDKTYGLIHLALNRLMGSAGSHGFTRISKISRELHDLMGDAGRDSLWKVDALVGHLIRACDEAIADTGPQVSGGFGKRKSEAPPSASVERDTRPLMLVADDDVTIRDLFSELFAEDARVITAVDAAEAHGMIERHSPDLVLLDDIMPGSITGLTLLERLKASARVIMITASDGEADRARGYAAGALDYITKPFDIGDVYGRVLRHLAVGV